MKSGSSETRESIFKDFWKTGEREKKLGRGLCPGQHSSEGFSWGSCVFYSPTTARPHNSIHLKELHKVTLSGPVTHSFRIVCKRAAAWTSITVHRESKGAQFGHEESKKVSGAIGFVGVVSPEWGLLVAVGLSFCWLTKWSLLCRGSCGRRMESLAPHPFVERH